MEIEYGIPPPGFRLPDATRLGGVHLQVSNLERSIGYYERVLGLRILAREAGTASLAAHGEDRALVWLHGRPGARPVPPRGVFGLYHFAILVPDRAALGRFLAHLAEIDEYAGSADHFVSEAIYLTDPDGLGIEVYADRPRAQWRHHDRQLYMTTERLDARGVIAAAGSARWDGMPSGTVLGHVHLHVGDIDSGAAFYHNAIGFDKMVWDYPGALFLAAGGYHHHLGTNTWSPGPAAADDQARLLSWDIVVPERAAVEAAARSLTANGFPVSRLDTGISGRDPWGTTVAIVADR